MVNTGKDSGLKKELISRISPIATGFEEYLPDEKISRKWEEVEVISTSNPDFETRLFRYNLDDTLILVSDDFEFFPIYAVDQVNRHGWPQQAFTAIFGYNEFLGIAEGAEVLVLAFINPEEEDRLQALIPSVSDRTDIDSGYLGFLADQVISDL